MIEGEKNEGVALESAKMSAKPYPGNW